MGPVSNATGYSAGLDKARRPFQKESESGDKVKLIFLDIDGVLNSEAYTRREGYKERNYGIDQDDDNAFDGRFEIDTRAVMLLNELVKKNDAHLVLSSTWRLGRRGLEFTKNALKHNGFEFNDRFMGVTPRLWRTPEGEERVRGHEIQYWLDLFGKVDNPVPVESFVIIDDDSDMAHLSHRLAKTSGYHGLTGWDCQRAEAILDRPLSEDPPVPQLDYGQ